MQELLVLNGIDTLKKILHKETSKALPQNQENAETISDFLTETINIIWKTFARTLSPQIPD